MNQTEDYLSEVQRSVRTELDRMNDIIRGYLATDSELMNEVVDTYLKTKGKQIRPLLVILSARMLGSVNDHVLHAAAALEMLHNASLIHDDVVDDTLTRRSRPTINAIWDNHIAVLVGDYFVSNALAAGIATGRLSIISALSTLGQELSLGEIDQICNARSHHIDEARYLDTIAKKTASLFMNCVRMGAEAAGAPEADIEPMVEYARLLGLTFQIKDDVFDYYDDKEVGKPTGNDLREGKVTLPLIHAILTAPEPEAAEARALLASDSLGDEEIARLTRFAIDRGGVDYAYTVMRDMQARAEQIISRYPDTEARRAFSRIFDYIISRRL